MEFSIIFNIRNGRKSGNGPSSRPPQSLPLLPHKLVLPHIQSKKKKSATTKKMAKESTSMVKSNMINSRRKKLPNLNSFTSKNMENPLNQNTSMISAFSFFFHLTGTNLNLLLTPWKPIKNSNANMCSPHKGKESSPTIMTKKSKCLS